MYYGTFSENFNVLNYIVTKLYMTNLAAWLYYSYSLIFKFYNMANMLAAWICMIMNLILQNVYFGVVNL